MSVVCCLFVHIHRFLKNLLQTSGLQVLSFTSTDLVKDIKEAVITGIPVLIEVYTVACAIIQ